MSLISRKHSGMWLAVTVLLSVFIFGGTSQASARDYDRDGYNGYRTYQARSKHYDRDGYRDWYGNYHRYEYRNHHRGYWNHNNNGFRFWINID
ncbi:MAG: hypothetical protein PHD76_02885 [Methylacidiphilales bacterium]|nr:hypothetical protein [Candidatus Methylacidiphilales bacterium]